MLGETRCRHLRVKTRVFKEERACCARHRAARILLQVDHVVRRTLDAETFGAFTQAEMQDEARAMLVKEAGTESRDLRPFGGKHLSMQCAPKTGRRAVRCQRLCQPGRGIFGDTRKRAEPGNEQVPASHDFGRSRAKRRREGHFVQLTLRRCRRGAQACPPLLSVSSRRSAPSSPPRASGGRPPCRL